MPRGRPTVVEQVRAVCALLRYVALVATSIFLGPFAYGGALAGPPDYVAELQLASTPGGFRRRTGASGDGEGC
jgi:hypothetical protein